MARSRNNRRVFEVLLWSALVVTLGLGWLMLRYGTLPARASTISLLHAADTFHQCARPAPVPDGAFWIPTASQIRAIEPHLPALGRRFPATTRNAPLPDTLFLHQYIGFTRAGQRLIYVNVAPDDGFNDDEAAFMFRLLPEAPWRFCDGGAFFWGVVYNPATNIFEAPVFNR